MNAPRDAGSELLGEHPGGLVDLGPVQCEVRGLPAGDDPRRRGSRRVTLAVEQQQGRGVGEDQRVTQLECAVCRPGKPGVLSQAGLSPLSCLPAREIAIPAALDPGGT